MSRVPPLILATVILCLSLIALCRAAAPAPADDLAGKVNKQDRTDPYFWDAGKVKEGDIAAHDFTILNSLDQDLNIKDITTSCGCTVSNIAKKNLKPGESTIVTVKFDTKGYKGDSKQFIYVNTDNAQDPIIRLTVLADVQS